MASSQAHPRVGGENRPCTTRPTSRPGSSPRGRGKRDWRSACLISPPAHPRVGGENADRPRVLHGGGGSSPRGRGKHLIRKKGTTIWRLIPAWAGKTGARRWCPTGAGAHPRVGGENGGVVDDFGLEYGSSPRGRGKPLFAEAAYTGAGLIPAWAGKT